MHGQHPREHHDRHGIPAGAVGDADGAGFASKICNAVTPEGAGHAVSHEIETTLGIETGFAVFLEGAQA